MRPLWHVLVNSTCTLSHLVTSCHSALFLRGGGGGYYSQGGDGGGGGGYYAQGGGGGGTNSVTVQQENEERFVLQCLARIQAAQTASSTTKQ